MSSSGSSAGQAAFPRAGKQLTDRRGLGAIAEQLSKPGVVTTRAFNKQAQATMNLIEAQKQDGRKAILAAPLAVWGLATNGQAQAVMALIKTQPRADQQAILAARHAVWGLATNGQGSSVERLRASWAAGKERPLRPVKVSLPRTEEHPR